MRVGYYSEVNLSKPHARAFHVLEIASRFDAVELFSKTDGEFLDEFSGFFERDGVNAHRLPGSRLSIGNEIAAVRILRKADVDAVYCRDSVLNVFPMLASRFLDVPVVVEVNNDNRYLMEFEERKLRHAGWLIEQVQRRNIRVADAVIYTCEPLKERFAGITDRGFVVEDAAPLSMVEEYADVERFETPTVSYMGSLAEMKGVQVIPGVAAELPEFEFLVIGDGHLRPQMEERAAELGADNLTFTGRLPRPEAVEKTSRSHVSLMPYPENLENMFSPFKLFESMAVGTPVVTTPGGEPARLVEETGAGIVSDGFGAESIASAIRGLMDEEKHAGCADAARRAVEETYNWERMASRTREIIRGTLEN